MDRAQVTGPMPNLRSVFAGVSAVVALLSIAGCGADPLAPKSSPALQASWGNGHSDGNGWRSDARGHGRWRFNTDKYKDNGSRPTIGTAGIASVQAEALIGEHGITRLEIYSFRRTDIDHPDGDMDRLTVRAFSPQGLLLFVRSYRDGAIRDAFVDDYPGLVPGAWLQIEAVVSGLDRHRMDVVTVGPVPVRRRPDLAVTGMDAPSVIVAGTPTIVTASVAELRGDRGARSDCVLYIGGRPVDRSRGIWVDAGDMVSCAFTWTFAAPGRYNLRVALENTTPRDQNPTNNSRELAASVIAPVPASEAPVTADFNASVRSGSVSTVDSGSARWTVQPTGFLLFDTRYLSTTQGTEQSAIMSGTLNTTVSLPLARIELRQTTGGLLVHGVTFDNVDADVPGSTCLSRVSGGGASFYLCANPLGFTAWTWVRTAGSVTYQSSNYENVWNGASYDVDTYVDNGTTDNGPPIPLGASFSFDVRLTSGANVYVMAARVPLAAANESDLSPWQCTTGTFTGVTGELISANSCFYSSYQFTGVAGAVQGSGVTAQPGASSVP